jgi:hypothetical protein
MEDILGVPSVEPHMPAAQAIALCLPHPQELPLVRQLVAMLCAGLASSSSPALDGSGSELAESCIMTQHVTRLVRILAVINNCRETGRDCGGMTLRGAHVDAVERIFDDKRRTDDTLCEDVSIVFGWPPESGQLKFLHPVILALGAIAAERPPQGATLPPLPVDHVSAVCHVVPILLARRGPEAATGRVKAEQGITTEEAGVQELPLRVCSQLLELFQSRAPTDGSTTYLGLHSQSSGSPAAAGSCSSTSAQGAPSTQQSSAIDSSPSSPTSNAVLSCSTANLSRLVDDLMVDYTTIITYADSLDLCVLCLVFHDDDDDDDDDGLTLGGGTGACATQHPLSRHGSCPLSARSYEVVDTLLRKDRSGQRPLHWATYSACFTCWKPYKAYDRKSGCATARDHCPAHKAIIGATVALYADQFVNVATWMGCPGPGERGGDLPLAAWLRMASVAGWLGQVCDETGYSNLHSAVLLTLAEYGRLAP